jgi:hypothetical protein
MSTECVVIFHHKIELDFLNVEVLEIMSLFFSLMVVT